MELSDIFKNGKLCWEINAIENFVLLEYIGVEVFFEFFISFPSHSIVGYFRDKKVRNLSEISQ
mgnify:CR=1 FL=1